MSIEPSYNLAKEFNKLSSRNEELKKQDATLRKEYTTLLRKISSLITTLHEMDSGLEEMEEMDTVKYIPSNVLHLIPGLQWYNDQFKLIEDIDDDSVEFTIPKELMDAYNLYKNTPLLFRDAQDSD